MGESNNLIDQVISLALGDTYAGTPHGRSLQRLRFLELLAHLAEENELAARLSDVLTNSKRSPSDHEIVVARARDIIESAPSVFNDIYQFMYTSPPPSTGAIRMVSSSGATALQGDVRQVGEQVAGRDLTVLNYSVSLPASQIPIPQQLPPDLADFCDRQKQLSFMVDHLSKTGDSVVGVIPPLCICGQGGIGKTALVVHFAHSVIDSFPNGQLYVDLRGVLPSPTLPLDILSEFLRALGFEGRRIPGDLQEAVSLYRSVVSDQALLVVLDNVKDEQQVRPLLPPSRNSRVVITSRKRLSALEGAVHLRLDVMSDGDSKILLQRLVGDSRVRDDPIGSDLILRYAAGLPLAVRILGARLAARPTWHLRRLAGLLEDEGNRLRHLRVGDLEVEASILASYNDLPAESRTYLSLLALIEGTQFGAWTAAAIFDVNLDIAEAILEELANAELLTIGGAGPNDQQTYQLHDLVRAFLRSRLDNEGSGSLILAATRRVMWTYIYLLKHANTKLEAVDLLEEISIPGDFSTVRFDPNSILLPDVSGWLRFERETIVSLVSRGRDLGLRECAWLLARSLAPCLDAYAYWSDWESTHVAALDAVAGLEDSRPEALVRRGLARLYEETSRWEESEQQIKKAMLFLQSSRGDNSLYASCLRILGDLHRDRGRFLESIDVYEHALEIFQEGSDQYWSAVLLRSLGDAHRDFGQWHQAVEYLHSARDAFTILGADRWTAAVSRSLGTVYRDYGPYRRALEVFEEALAVFVRVGDRSLEAQTLQGIGDTYRNMGETDRAIIPLEKARRMLTTLGDMRRAAVAIRSLADIQRRISNYDDAGSLLLECSNIFKQLGDYRWELYSRRTEGLLLLDRGELEAAFVVFDECYRAFVELADERWRGNCLRCLGEVYYAQGSYEQARTVLLECVEIFIQVDENRWLGKTYRGLGRVAQALNDGESAIGYYIKALEIFRDIDAFADARIVEESLRIISSIGDD